jgi:hypothetical protein
MGLTEEGIRACAQRKLGLGRVDSASTASTAGSGEGGLVGGEKMGGG